MFEQFISSNSRAKVREGGSDTAVRGDRVDDEARRSRLLPAGGFVVSFFLDGIKARKL